MVERGIGLSTSIESQRLFERAKQLFPGGVSSPVRAFAAVGGEPRFIARGAGARLWDVDGNEYLDYVCSWGALALGHAHPNVIEAIEEAARTGTSFGAPSPYEVELAGLITEALPSIQMLRFVSSGTEAAMSALRVARAFVGRDKILKFAGCYHGHADGLLVKAGSGGLTFSVPDSAGVPEAMAALTLTALYNDTGSVERLFQQQGEEVAAVIVEPIAANMGLVAPEPQFLQRLRSLCDHYGCLLIFDEVITGFRLAYGGAQTVYGVIPDLTCLGKIIGGGLPVGAYGGRREIMELVSPQGPVYQAGTLSGNPVAMAAGIATLKELQKPGTYQRLEALAVSLREGLTELARSAGIPLTVAEMGSMLTPFFSARRVIDNQTAKIADTRAYAGFFHELLRRGIYVPPSQFEAWFLSTAHTEDDVQATLSAAAEAFGASKGSAGIDHV